MLIGFTVMYYKTNFPSGFLGQNPLSGHTMEEDRACDAKGITGPYCPSVAV